MTADAPIRRLAPSVAVLLLGGGVLFAATGGFRALTEEGARRLQAVEAQPVMPLLVLEDAAGVPVTLGPAPDAPDRLTLVEFIYATCPTLCRVAGADYARLSDRVRRAGLGGEVRLLSVSFDPERDDPEQLARYADEHGADGEFWTVARVRADDLDLMKRRYGLRVIADGWGGYEHNGAIHLVDRSGRLVGIFDVDDVEGAFRALTERL